MRRLIGGVGPARNFSLVSRERVLEGTRTIHIERGCVDPCGAHSNAPAKRPCIGTDGNDAELAGASANPLFAVADRIHLAPGATATDDGATRSSSADAVAVPGGAGGQAPSLLAQAHAGPDQKAEDALLWKWGEGSGPSRQAAWANESRSACKAHRASPAFRRADMPACEVKVVAMGRGGAMPSHIPTAAVRLVRCPGGSPYIIFQNRFEASAKRLAPTSDLDGRGKMKPEARAKVQQECKDAWAAMPPDERAGWLEIYHARQRERKRTAEQACLSLEDMGRCHHLPVATPTECSDSPAKCSRRGPTSVCCRDGLLVGEGLCASLPSAPIGVIPPPHHAPVSRPTASPLHRNRRCPSWVKWGPSLPQKL